VIIEGDAAEAAGFDPCNDLGFGLEIECLVTQMDTGVGRKSRCQATDGRND
jgi:hypothetical protein